MPGYGDLREATSTLTAAGVAVARSEMTELAVTAVLWLTNQRALPRADCRR